MSYVITVASNSDKQPSKPDEQMSTTETTQVITIEERAVYGRFNYYVIGEHAAAVQMLTHKKTVDACDVRALESLGFTCRVAGRPEMPACEAMR